MMRRLCLILSAAAGLLLLCGILLHRKKAPAAGACYLVYRTETGTAEEIPVKDYLIGAVGAEMPPSFHPEALKAQTVAAHTYADYFRRQQAVHPDPALHGAELSDDSAHCQAYLPPALLRERYGDAAYAAVEAAVDAASGLLLCCGGEPALTVYHACSSGRTESAEHVWGTAVPYLIPVGSAWDQNAPQYAAAVTFSAAEVQAALQNAGLSPALPENPAQWFTEPVCSESGTVLHIRCGDTVLTGQRLRGLLGLRSACFSVSCADGVFTFRTKGAGHGAGMSQYGADAMAKQGYGFADILQHYYPGTALLPQETPQQKDCFCFHFAGIKTFLKLDESD